MSLSAVRDLSLSVGDVVLGVDASATAKRQEEVNLETLLDAVEQQQRWLYLLLEQASLMCVANEDLIKKSREITEHELSALETSVAGSTQLVHELGNMLKTSTAEAQRQITLAQETAQSAMKELNEVHSERVASEVDGIQQMRSLEKTFEKMVREKDDELAVLRTQLKSSLEESVVLKTEISQERAVSKGLKASEAAKEKTSTGNAGLVHAALEALWQVSAAEKQADLLHVGSPTLIVSIYQQMRSIYASSTFNAPSSSKHSPSSAEPNFEILPSLCGVVVNIAATSLGRRSIAEFERGQLIVFLVGSVEKLTYFMANQGASSDIVSVLELTLCIISNMASEKVYAIQVLEAGLINALRLVIASTSATLDIRRYAINMIQSNLGFVPATRKTHQTAIVSQIAEIITSLSKDPHLKVPGHALLTQLYNIMPSED